MDKHSNLSLSSNGDCLNTIRLIAVLQVVFGHTTRWLEIPFSDFVGHVSTIWQGVPIFFLLSGFLIWYSIGRSRSFKEYALKRFWRLYPELWVAVLFEIIVIIAIYDHPIEWGSLALFAVSEGTAPFWVPDFLNDYGTGKPNAALWTIFCLVKFYVIAFFMYKSLKGRSMWQWSIVLLALVGLGHLTAYLPAYLPPMLCFVYKQTTLPFLWLFAFGTFIADWWGRGAKELILRYWPFAFVVTVFVEFSGIDIDCSDPAFGYFLIRCVSTLIWILGLAYTFPKFNIKTDISYALFLYHMTIVQILYTYGYMHYPILIIVVMVVSCILAYFSTRYIGEWSKKRKLQLVSN